MKTMTKAEVLEVLEDAMLDGTFDEREKARATVSELYDAVKVHKEVCANDVLIIFNLRAEVERLKRAVDRKNGMLRDLHDLIFNPNSKIISERCSTVYIREAISYNGEPT